MNRTRDIALLAALLGADVVQGAEVHVLSTSPGRLSAEYGWSPARRLGTDGRDVALRRVADGTIRRIDLGSGRADYVLATLPDVIPTVSQAPSGHYDGTPDAIRNAWISREDEPWPLDCFDAILHDPAVVRRAAAGEGSVATPSLPRPPDLEARHPITRAAIMDAEGRVATEGGPAAPIRMVARSAGGVAWFEVERVGEAATSAEILRIGADAEPSPERVLRWTIPEAWRSEGLELRIRARAVDGTRSKPVLLALAPGKD